MPTNGDIIVDGVKYSPASCALCKGDGLYTPFAQSDIECPSCKGSGRVLAAVPQMSCGRCGGMGIIKDMGIEVICHICHGCGWAFPLKR